MPENNSVPVKKKVTWLDQVRPELQEKKDFQKRMVERVYSKPVNRIIAAAKSEDDPVGKINEVLGFAALSPFLSGKEAEILSRALVAAKKDGLNQDQIKNIAAAIPEPKEDFQKRMVERVYSKPVNLIIAAAKSEDGPVGKINEVLDSLKESRLLSGMEMVILSHALVKAEKAGFNQDQIKNIAAAIPWGLDHKVLDRSVDLGADTVSLSDIIYSEELVALRRSGARAIVECTRSETLLKILEKKNRNPAGSGEPSLGGK